jgi:hypothetical protein
LSRIGALGAVNQAHRHALAHAFDRAPHIGLHAGRRGRAVELQGKELLFVNALVGVGPHACTNGPPLLN